MGLATLTEELIETEQLEHIGPKLSPLRAVRVHCLSCCCGQANEVRLCPAETCALWPYRFGRSPKEKPELTPLKSIKARCLDCSGHIAKEVRECWDTGCALYPCRMGKNPNLRGKRGKGNPESLERYRQQAKSHENFKT